MTSKLVLPAAIYSPDQLQFCIDELQAYGAASSKAKATELSEDSQLLLPLAGAKPTATSIGALVTQLEVMLTEAPRVDVVLVAMPGQKLKAELTTWFRTKAHSQSLLYFHANPDIAGGMIVRTTNKVHDFSFRSRLLNDTDRFIKVLDRV